MNNHLNSKAVQDYICGSADKERTSGIKLLDKSTLKKFNNLSIKAPTPSLRQRVIPLQLMDEYDKKLSCSDQTTKPFITQELQFKAAAYLLEDGYRDSEIEMGEEFSSDFGSPFQWIVRLKAPLPEAILKRRRAWRKVMPYKWLAQRWYKLLPFQPSGLKFWKWKRIAPIRWSA